MTPVVIYQCYLDLGSEMRDDDEVVSGCLPQQTIARTTLAQGVCPQIRQLHVQHLPRVSAHRSIEYSAYNYLVKSSKRAPDWPNCLEQPITVCRRKRAHTQYILRVARAGRSDDTTCSTTAAAMRDR